jgi:hypothetical protein
MQFAILFIDSGEGEIIIDIEQFFSIIYFCNLAKWKFNAKNCIRFKIK